MKKTFFVAPNFVVDLVDEQMGFIKFGSRVDVYLPVGTEVLIEMDQKVTGNQTPIARLSK